jgi:DNA polymerase-3 subunit gamma/tau
MSIALYRKWRPTTWEEVVGQDHVIQTLRNSVASDRLAHAYLFAGPRGTGKTSTARLLAKAANCQAKDLAKRPDDECAFCVAINENRFLDLIEIDAASNTSVEDVRNLRDKINFRPNEGRFKVYIIDEVHMLSTAAFNALLKTLEEPPPHAIFILATTEIHKVPATVLSRCQRHEFRLIPMRTIVDYLATVVEGEELNAEAEALETIARQATGSLRDAVSLLDQLASMDETITPEMARTILGSATQEIVMEVVDALVQSDAPEGLRLLNEAMDAGSDPRQLGRQIVDHLRDLLLLEMGNADLVTETNERKDHMQRQAAELGVPRITRSIRSFGDAVATGRASWLPGLPLELAFIDAYQDHSSGSAPQNRQNQDAPVPGRPSNPPQKSQQAGRVPVPKPSSDVSEQSEPDERATAQLESSDPTQQGQRAGDVIVPEQSSHLPQQREQNQGVPAEIPQGGDLQFKQITGRWKDILTAAYQYDPRTQALLNSCKPMGLDKGSLILGFSSDLLREKMEKGHSLSFVQRALEDVFSVSIEVRCVLADHWRGGGKSETLPVKDGGIVATAMQDLGAQVVDVKRLPPES